MTFLMIFYDVVRALVLTFFDVEAGLERYLEESEEKDITKLFRLQFDYDTYFQPQQGAATTNGTAASSSLRLSCTGVSWNATGSVIAVAYGRFDHSGWCNYRSALCLWNVFQSDLNPQKPSLVLETSVSPSSWL